MDCRKLRSKNLLFFEANSQKNYWHTQWNNNLKFRKTKTHFPKKDVRWPSQKCALWIFWTETESFAPFRFSFFQNLDGQCSKQIRGDTQTHQPWWVSPASGCCQPSLTGGKCLLPVLWQVNNWGGARGRGQRGGVGSEVGGGQRGGWGQMGGEKPSPPAGGGPPANRRTCTQKGFGKSKRMFCQRRRQSCRNNGRRTFRTRRKSGEANGATAVWTRIHWIWKDCSFCCRGAFHCSLFSLHTWGMLARWGLTGNRDFAGFLCTLSWSLGDFYSKIWRIFFL